MKMRRLCGRCCTNAGIGTGAGARMLVANCRCQQCVNEVELDLSNAPRVLRRVVYSGRLPWAISSSHWSINGQSMAQVPKSAICRYPSNRAMVLLSNVGSLRKIGP